MADKSKIEWTNATWNPVTGCTKVSDGCKNCYAKRDWQRLSANPKTVYFGRAFEDVQYHIERLDQPLKWQKPRMIFVNSMSDLFHESVPFLSILHIFGVMSAAYRHTYQILTKRPERAAEFFEWATQFENSPLLSRYGISGWPLKNVWLGISVEDNKTAQQRIPYLEHFNVGIKWVSAELMKYLSFLNNGASTALLFLEARHG